MEERVTPIEFQLSVCRKKFTIKDVYNIFGIFLYFAMANKTDPLLTDIRNKYGMEYLKDFGLDGELNTTLLKKNAKENPEF
jgi:penicillin amidase